MFLKKFYLSVSAESEEKAVKKIKKNIKHAEDDNYLIDFDLNIFDHYFNKSDGTIVYDLSNNDVFQNLKFAFTVSKEDKEMAKRIYETVNQPLSEKAKSYLVDDRGRITLGANYADKEDVKVIILEE